MNAAGAIGAITVPLVCRTPTPIGLRSRTRAARPGSVISAAGSVMVLASSQPVISAMLWSVPPEMMSEGRGMPLGCVDPHRQSTSESRSPQRSWAVSAASCTARSAGSASNPLTSTIFTPASAAAASNSSIIWRTNGISPVRSA